MKERKDRVDDAMHATRAAVEEGILPGGGVALLRASEALKKVKTANDDQKAGVEIVRKAIQAPARQIASTPAKTARSSSARSSRRISTTTASTPRPASTATWSSKGIIDPTKVVRAAIQNAASVAGLLITTEAMVAEMPQKKGAAAGGMPRRHAGRHGRHGLLVHRSVAEQK